MLGVCEAILLSESFNQHDEAIDSVIREAKKIQAWRLRNNYQWSHSIRNDFWYLLASMFPAALQPIGRVDAWAEYPMVHLNKVWPLVAKSDLFCSKCGSELGRFKLTFEDPCLLSHPYNSDLSKSEYTLNELLMCRVNEVFSRNARVKVKCSLYKCQGHGSLHTILPFQIEFPKFLFLHFGIIGSGSNLHLGLKDSCTLSDKLNIGNAQLELNSILLAKPMHFFSIVKMFGWFYKLDNMYDSKTASGYSTLREAYMDKLSDGSDLFHLGNKTVKSRKGVPFFAIYENKSWKDENSEENFQDLNTMLSFTKEDNAAVKADGDVLEITEKEAQISKKTTSNVVELDSSEEVVDMKERKDTLLKEAQHSGKEVELSDPACQRATDVVNPSEDMVVMEGNNNKVDSSEVLVVMEDIRVNTTTITGQDRDVFKNSGLEEINSYSTADKDVQFGEQECLNISEETLKHEVVDSAGEFDENDVSSNSGLSNAENTDADSTKILGKNNRREAAAKIWPFFLQIIQVIFSKLFN